MLNTKYKLSLMCFSTCICILVIPVQTETDLDRVKLNIVEAITKLQLSLEELNRNNDVINTTLIDGDLEIIGRDSWQARPAIDVLEKLELPVHRVIISHTGSDFCDSTEVCAKRIQTIQNFHMNSLRMVDIGYNYLIGNDGRVYIGRGWESIGTHTKGYNQDSVGISFIGTFTTMAPTERALNALKLLLEEGVRLKKLVKDYRLHGQRQMSPTESPGLALFQILQKWPHFSTDLNNNMNN